MKKMVMMKKIDDLNNEKDEKKWQSMVLEMKIEEIECSIRGKIPSNSLGQVGQDTEEKEKNQKFKFLLGGGSHIVGRSLIDKGAV
ncbi:hypothetical protein Tco_0581320 [Tanacetum coccineum]